MPRRLLLTRQEFNQDSDGNWIQSAELIYGLNARLIPIGDLITRSLRQRIESRRKVIQTLRLQVHQRVLPARLGGLAEMKQELQTAQVLEESFRHLEAIVFAESDALLRDSCVSLTQVYAAMHPTPQLEWLRIDESLVQKARGIFPILLRGYCGGELHDRIACAVREMGRLYRGSDPNVSELDAAIASGGLVIHKESQAAWWEGIKLDLGSGKKNWEFLAALARQSQLGCDVKEADLYPRATDSLADSTMANRWNRLGKQLPGTLAQRIHPGTLPRTYRLDLDRSRIFVIR